MKREEGDFFSLFFFPFFFGGFAPIRPIAFLFFFFVAKQKKRGPWLFFYCPFLAKNDSFQDLSGNRVWRDVWGVFLQNKKREEKGQKKR